MYKFELNEVVYHAAANKKSMFKRPNPMVIIGRGTFETSNGISEVNYIVSLQNDQLEKTFSRHILLECELIKIEQEPTQP